MVFAHASSALLTLPFVDDRARSVLYLAEDAIAVDGHTVQDMPVIVSCETGGLLRRRFLPSGFMLSEFCSTEYMYSTVIVSNSSTVVSSIMILGTL